MRKRECTPSSAFFQVFSYPTEDVDKVLSALYSIIPESLNDKLSVDLSTVRGHFGEPIIIINAKLEKSRDVDIFLKHLVNKLSSSAKRRLSRNLDKLIDDHANLYIRLSKQDAYFGSIKLGHKDIIKAKIHFIVFGDKKEKIRKYFEDLGLTKDDKT
ncbi:MAG: RNA-binding domain-containing protein [Candidatus Asgardarchaeia archaeon]